MNKIKKQTGKALEKQINTMENEEEKQIKAIEEHGKLVESNALVKKMIMVVKNYKSHSKEILDKLVAEKKSEII